MWRSLFLAIGVYACLLGAQCLLIDKAVLASSTPSSPGLLGSMQQFTAKKKEWTPAEWVPWGLLSVGALTILYSITLPRRKE